MSVVPVQAISLLNAAPALRVAAPIMPPAPPPVSFAAMLTQGIEAANAKVVRADQLVGQAAVDDNIPLHQVTFALEEARISLELLVQVRNRVLDASQQLLNMQV